MMQVYTILYSKDGAFLTFNRPDKYYFFHGKKDRQATIYPQGVSYEEKAGLFAFPGGELEEYRAYKGCLREFIEECGSNITFTYKQRNFESMMSLSAIKFGEIAFDILKIDRKEEAAYFALYLQVEPDALAGICYLISETNFAKAQDAINAILKEGSIYTQDQYPRLIKDFYPCPADNELEHATVWNIDKDIALIEKLNDLKKKTEWYYAMIEHIRTLLPGVVNPQREQEEKQD